MKPSFPIIFLTALGEQEHLARALDLEADDYLAKPFGGTELLGPAHGRPSGRAFSAQ